MIYWKYDEAINKETCNKIIKINKNKWADSAIGIGETKKYRDSVVSFTTDQWLYDIVFSFMKDANKKTGWNFKIQSAQEMQITKYVKDGFYNYHMDGDGFSKIDAPNNKFVNGLTRKLSMTIVLNDDYEGGEFQFFADEENLIKEKRGTIIVFPSYMMHRVKPIKSGTRYALVVWFLGKPFR